VPPSQTEDSNDDAVEDVAAYLREYGIRVQIMPADTATAAAAAATLQTDVASIVKSLLFMHQSTPILALVSGTRKVNKQHLATVMGVGPVRLAQPNEVAEVTGYNVGGVPPVAHRRPLRVAMDRHLMALPVVYAAAGSNVAIFEIEPAMLSRIAHAEIADFAE
jgi:prolyl-tRNA editing enzyme YbaK/EbsC (Cys-tRNA(Pro) deacylase)